MGFAFSQPKTRVWEKCPDLETLTSEEENGNVMLRIDKHRQWTTCQTYNTASVHYRHQLTYLMNDSQRHKYDSAPQRLEHRSSGTIPRAGLKLWGGPRPIPNSSGGCIHMGVGKIGDFRRILSFIPETVRDKPGNNPKKTFVTLFVRQTIAMPTHFFNFA